MTAGQLRQQGSYVYRSFKKPGAAAHQSQIPRAGGTGFQRVHVTLMKLQERVAFSFLPLTTMHMADKLEKPEELYYNSRRVSHVH